MAAPLVVRVRTLHVLCVAGARPNFMKVQPILAGLARAGVRTTLVHTGQHYDRAMSDVFIDELGLPAPDIALGVGSGSHARQVGEVMVRLEPVIAELAPDAVVVVGDVNSTLAAALVAAKAGVVVAHVEAGLRSHDWSMPEEVNRVVVDRVSDLLLASSEDAVDNLMAEGCHPGRVHLVGNVMIDTLLANLERAKARTVLADLDLEATGYVLATLHRPANVDHPEVRGSIFSALATIAGTTPVVLPAHPRLRPHLGELDGVEGIRVVEPMGYLDFVALEASASLVLTDSGGVQEETTVLGVPCLTLRDNTERPITVTDGTNRVVGRRSDAIVAAAREVLASPPPRRCPELWDGRAADRIVGALLDGLHQGVVRPTEAPSRVESEG